MIRRYRLPLALLSLSLLFVVACLVGRSRPISTLRRIESAFTDVKFQLRGTRFPKEKVVIVDVDDASLSRMGRWPWRRDVTAFLVDQIFAAGAKVVALDVTFPEPTEAMPEELEQELRQRKLGPLIDKHHPDQRFVQTIANHSKNLVGAWQSEGLCQPRFKKPADCPIDKEEFREGIPDTFLRFALPGSTFAQNRSAIWSAPVVVPNISIFEEKLTAQGFANGLRDPDGVVRRAPLLVAVDGKLYPSLALATASRALGSPIRVTTDERGNLVSLNLGKNQAVRTGSDAIGQINYRGPSHSYTYLSAVEVLGFEPGRPRELAETSVQDHLEDAVVLVGVSALGASDIASGPYDSHLPGVEIHATLVDNLLSNDLLSAPPAYFFFFVLCLFALPLATSFWTYRLRAATSAAAFGGIFFGTAALDVGGLFARNINLPTGFLYLSLFSNYFVTLFARYASEEKQRKFLKTAFSKYVSPRVVDQLLRNRQLTLGGRKETLSILFCDIRDFTTFSEAHDAPEVGNFLNEYLDLLTEIVFLQGGTVDKYIGDAIMAFWGAPLGQPDHARRAVTAAFEIQKAVLSYHDYFESKYKIDLRIGIGLHTGPVVVGNMGSRRTFSYTCIGDSVNLAARLESATKEQKVSCLLSAATLQAAYPLPEGLSTRPMGSIHVKGKEQAIEVHELVPPASAAQLSLSSPRVK